MFDTKILSGVEASHALYDSLHDRIHALKEKGVTPGRSDFKTSFTHPCRNSGTRL